MTSIDIAALGAAPPTDATCASADTPAGVSEVFAALLDEAAGAADEACEEEDGFDELAALSMTSLLSIGVSVPPAPTTDPASGGEVIATDITDPAVVTDLTDRGALVDVSISSQWTRTVGNDMGLDTSEELVMTDAVSDTSPTEPAKNAAGEAASAEKNATTDAVETPQAAPKTAAAMPVIEAATAEDDAPQRETKAAAGKAEADAKPAPKGARSSKPSRADEASSPRKIEGIDVRATHAASSMAAAGHSADEVRGTARAQQVADVRGSGSTAARFARALERAAALTTSETSGETSAANTNTGGNGQPSGFGDAASNRAAQFSAAIKHSMPGGVAFTVNAPAPVEARALVAEAASAAAHALETAPMTIPERDVIAQLVQSLRVQFRDGIGEAVVKLKPEHLGSVQISLRVENGAIKATVQAEAPAVRQWLESQQDTLRTSLAEQGLRLERFVVEPEGEPKHAADDSHQHQREREQRRRQQQRRMSEKDQPLFEVTV